LSRSALPVKLYEPVIECTTGLVGAEPTSEQLLERVGVAGGEQVASEAQKIVVITKFVVSEIATTKSCSAFR
jgi:hypothetical protein